MRGLRALFGFRHKSYVTTEELGLDATKESSAAQQNDSDKLGGKKNSKGKEK